MVGSQWGHNNQGLRWAVSANKDKAAKIIIDTDPGIDDAMAIHLAFADARLELLALTSVFR
jgi:hypothetical protein